MLSSEHNSNVGAGSADGDAQRPSGAASPHIVIRGESTRPTQSFCHHSLANKVSFIDYLSFSFRPNKEDNQLIELQEILLHLFSVMPESWLMSTGGWYGYTHRANLDGHGLVAWGGESQKGTYHVEITGDGCHKVFDWLDVYYWGISNDIRITRLDIAHDDFDGEILNIANGIKWYYDGLFKNRGRSPKLLEINDHKSGDGNTLNIGKRENGRVIRIYEKGKEQGNPYSSWCRAELETRSKDRKIPWDAVINPDHFLAGSCKALSFLSTTQSRIKTIAKAKTTSLNKAINHSRNVTGKLINTLLHVEGYKPVEIIEMLRRDGIPDRLKHKYPFADIR